MDLMEALLLLGCIGIPLLLGVAFFFVFA